MLGAFGAIVPELIDRSGGNIPGAGVLGHAALYPNADN